MSRETKTTRPGPKAPRRTRSGWWIHSICPDCGMESKRSSPRKLKGLWRYSAPCNHCGTHHTKEITRETPRYVDSSSAPR